MRASAYVAALATASLALASGAGQAADLSSKLTDVRAFVTELCPVSKQQPEALGALLAAAVIPQLVGSGVDMVGAALTAAGQDKATTLKANTVFPFYRSDGETKLDRSSSFGCLVIIGTEFGYEATESNNSPSAFPNETWQGAQIKENPRLALKGPPRFYFEAKVVFDRQKGAFRLVPVLYRLAAPRESSLLGSNKVSTVITINFAVPGSTTPFASHVFTLPQSDTPVEVQLQGLFGMTSAWLPMYPTASIISNSWDTERKRQLAVEALKAKEKVQQPSLDSAEVKALVDKYCEKLRANPKGKDKADATNCPEDYEALLADITRERAKIVSARELADLKAAIDPSTAQPIAALAQTNVDVVIVETRTGSKFAAYLGAALTASKADIVNAAKAQLPEARRAADNAAADAQNDAEVAAIAAKVEGIKAQEALDKLDANATAATRQQKEADLLAAKIKANKAFRKAGQPEPYPGISLN